MADLHKITHAAMRSLVKSYGCYDAVADLLDTSKGTISKKMSGQLEWSAADIITLQDALGRYPVTRAWARQTGGRSNAVAECLVTQGGVIAVETGEAVFAILLANQSASANDRANAWVEIQQAISALQAALPKLMDDKPSPHSSDVVPFEGTVT